MSENNFNSAILVTSSFHMPRAKKIFDKAGVVTEAHATDHKVTGSILSWLHFIPSAAGLQQTSSGIREYIGRLYYQLKL